jgi:glycosyltransferase involved in cell wall biosynthesis
MSQKVFVYDPTASDKLSAVRGIGRYLQILKENFPEWTFSSEIKKLSVSNIFINPFFNFLQPPLIFKKIAKKQIAVIHDLIPLKYPSHFPIGIKGSLYVFLNKLSLKNYDLIITDSEASKSDIIRILGIEEKNIKVIYPCLPKTFTEDHKELDAQNDYPKYEIPNTKYCVYVGDTTWNKNLVMLSQAIKRANISCVFVGKAFKNSPTTHPWQKEFSEFYRSVNGDKRFIFSGFIPDLELIKLYQQSLVNILPSRDEGFGFSFVESSQFGCPSLLSDIPVLKEISGGKAIFFNPESPQELTDKINEINSDKILRNKIGAAAKKRSEFFSPKKFKKEFLTII